MASRSLEQLLARQQALQRIAASSPELGGRIQELRTWQAARLARTYADLRATPQYSCAVEFFLSDIYGPHDFTRRDRDLARAASQLRRALPRALLEILCAALELDVLSTELDQQMASRLTTALTEPFYGVIYRAVGRPADRQRQINLVCETGAALNALVAHPWVGLALRAAHLPAHLAGLGALQDFLERGWAAFRSLRTGDRLLEEIRRRETALMDALFQDRGNPFASDAVAIGGSGPHAS